MRILPSVTRPNHFSNDVFSNRIHRFVTTLFFGIADCPNAIAEQNIFCMRGANAIDRAPTGGGSITRNNTLLYCEVGAHGSVQP
ncbi:MAG: hypothetical protein WBH14_14285, partial [Albidovulum sp.]